VREDAVSGRQYVSLRINSKRHRGPCALQLMEAHARAAKAQLLRPHGSKVAAPSEAVDDEGVHKLLKYCQRVRSFLWRAKGELCGWRLRDLTLAFQL
jgi:hypothetical protein